jgi:hypothetical protein
MTTPAAAKSECTACNKMITSSNWSRHIKSQEHAKNTTSQKISTTPAAATITKRTQAALAVDAVLELYPAATISKICEVLEETYALSTIENYLRLGYFLPHAATWTKRTLAQNELFMRNLRDRITATKDESPFTPAFIIQEKLEDSTIPTLAKLYMLMPIRSEAFCKIVLTPTDRPDETETNYINTTTGTLTTYGDKTTSYERIKLDKATVQLVGQMTNSDKRICPNSKYLQRLLMKHLDSNTFEIRRIYAIQHTDDIYAARILGHKVSTHRGIYKH